MCCKFMPGPSAVLASRQIQSAWNAFVIHIFCPLMIRSSPRLTALVVDEATSLPGRNKQMLRISCLDDLFKILF